MPDFVLGGGIEVVIDPPVPTEVIVVPIQGAGGPGGGAVSSVNTQTGAVVLDQDDIADGATAKQYTATDKAKLAAISGTNTGDQDLSGLVPNTRTINGEPLSGNVVLDAADVGAATTAQGGKADSAVQPGDLIVPSGQQDGAGIAVHPMEASSLVAIQAVGQAWQATGDGEGAVQVGVGSPQLSAVLNRLATELVVLQAQNAALEARIGALEEAVSAGK